MFLVYACFQCFLTVKKHVCYVFFLNFQINVFNIYGLIYWHIAYFYPRKRPLHINVVFMTSCFSYQTSLWGS